MLAAVLPLLAGPLGRVVLYVVGAAGLAVAVSLAVVAYDDRIRADLVATQQAAEAAQTIARQQAAMTALSVFTAQQRSAAEAQAATLQEVAHAPVSTACAGSAAVRSALRGVRSEPAAAVAVGGAGRIAATPTGAGGAR